MLNETTLHRIAFRNQPDLYVMEHSMTNRLRFKETFYLQNYDTRSKSFDTRGSQISDEDGW